MDKLCINCKYLGKEVKSKYYYIIPPIILLVFGIFLYSYFIPAIVWIVFGLYTLVKFIDNKNICPICKKTNTMIPLDTPRAQEIIKKNNLTVPTESPDQTKAPTT